MPFAAFILACGTTHLMEAIIFWWPAYRLAGVIKLFTALVSMLKGVRFREGLIETDTVVMRSVTGTVRWIRAEHRQFGKFHLE